MNSYWKTRTTMAAAIALVACGTMLAQSGTSADTKFVKEAAIGGMTEVQLGKLAVKNASSEKVKDFGQKMIDDHTKAADELKSVASKDNITLPTVLDPKHQAIVDKMSSLNGTAFDRAYMQNMVKDHQQDVNDFQREANNGNGDLKSFAGKTLPTLQEHLKLARDTQTSLSTTSRK